MSQTFTNQKYGVFKNHYFYLVIIVICAISIRIFYFEPEIPLTMDNLVYFLYAAEINIQGQLSSEQTPANNGWPIFLGFIFSLFKFEDPITYMNLQKITSIIISSITIIPIYFLSKHFFSRTLSMMCAILFCFEPRIIQNSILGVTEPLYILLATFSLLCIFSENKKIVYSSFAIAAIVSMIRAEGVVLILILSIIFFVKYRKSQKVFFKYLPAIIIFLLVLSPMIMYKQEVLGEDLIFSRLSDAVMIQFLTPEINSPEWNELTNSQKKEIDEGKYNELNFFTNGIENYSKFLAWGLIPIFILFIPIGIIQIFKKIDYKKITIILSLLVFSLPAFYAYALSSLDSRYFFVLYPLFCIISIFGIEKILNKIQSKKILYIIIIGIIFASITFIELQKEDFTHEKESFLVAQFIVQNTGGVNYFSPESQYIKVAEVIKNWPNLPSNEFGHFEMNMPRFSTEKYNSIEEFIETNKDKGLTHIVIDDKSNRPEFLKDVFRNENNDMLKKIYDSKENKFEYHVKIFEIKS
jgi:hypothetical protein